MVLDISGLDKTERVISEIQPRYLTEQVDAWEQSLQDMKNENQRKGLLLKVAQFLFLLALLSVAAIVLLVIYKVFKYGVW
jgi:Flp pilus assembly protein TadB